MANQDVVTVVSSAPDAAVSSPGLIPQYLPYRPDIDGMRAVAALAVVGTHVGLIPGGLVGVDVFFVISGYLISGLILRALKRENFSLLDFYARRTKRIFPALIVVLVFACLAGWITLLAGEFRLLGRDVAEGAAFILNLTSLFHPAAPFRGEVSGLSLFHLWSLGVEEQFYLLWPLFLLCTCKLGKVQIYLIAFVTIVSSAINIVVSSHDLVAAYELPWTRLWELSLGGLLARIEITPASRRKSMLHVRALLGTALIVLSCLGVGSSLSAFQWWALAPATGAALLISAGPETPFNRTILAARPMVLIGLISYPLYIWHVPILTLATIVEPDGSTLVTAAAILTTFMAAFLTYKYVERPVRSSKGMLVPAVTLSVTMLSCGVVGYLIFRGSIPARSEPYDASRFDRVASENWLEADRESRWTLIPGEFLKIGNGPRHVLYVGDSNMAQYFPRIERILAHSPGSRYSATFALRDWCAPGVAEAARTSGADRDQCRNMLQRAFRYAEASEVDTIVIGACWQCYLWDIDDLDRDSGQLDPRADELLDNLENVIADLSALGKKVYVILDIPMGLKFDPHRLVRRTIFPPGYKVVKEPVKRADIGNLFAVSNRKVSRAARSAGAYVIDPSASICDADSCMPVSADGTPRYHDWWNLSPSYVRDSARFLDETILDSVSSQ